jgi:hypothetical protein
LTQPAGIDPEGRGIGAEGLLIAAFASTPGFEALERSFEPSLATFEAC